MAQAVAIYNGDIDLRGGGPRLVRGVQAAEGALYYRFSTFSGTGPENPGEWRYDYTYGVPWRTAVFGRYFKIDETQAVLADVASRTTGVSPVTAFQVQLTIDTTTRLARITINRLKVGGTVVVEPVVLTVSQGSLSA